VTVVAILPHDQAVLDALEATGRPVGFAVAPEGALDGVRTHTGPDYLIVYPISGLRAGSMAGDEEVALVYQTTIVGRTAAGVRWLVDQVEAALQSVAVPGRTVIRAAAENIGDVRPDNDITPPVFLATPRFTVWTTPTT
jgi:hypothetical protein